MWKWQLLEKKVFSGSGKISFATTWRENIFIIDFLCVRERFGGKTSACLNLMYSALIKALYFKLHPQLKVYRDAQHHPAIFWIARFLFIFHFPDKLYNIFTQITANVEITITLILLALSGSIQTQKSPFQQSRLMSRTKR